VHRVRTAAIEQEATRHQARESYGKIPQVILITDYMGHFINNAQGGKTAEWDDAIPVNVMSVTVEYLRKQHVCSLLP